MPGCYLYQFFSDLLQITDNNYHRIDYKLQISSQQKCNTQISFLSLPCLISFFLYFIFHIYVLFFYQFQFYISFSFKEVRDRCPRQLPINSQHKLTRIYFRPLGCLNFLFFFCDQICYMIVCFIKINERIIARTVVECSHNFAYF